MENFTKINLGGGRNKKEGFTNLDIINYPEVDIVTDLNKGIPLPDNSVEEVSALSVLEHLDDTCFIMEEIYRVCKKDALVTITVPYVKSTAAFKDPTHKRFFSERTFEYFDKRSKLPDYQLKCNLRIEKISYKYYTPWFRLIPGLHRFLARFFWDIIKTMTVELRTMK
jgi:ubiquinone/menaquinone biosynthesis C-methylase UbiE